MWIFQTLWHKYGGLEGFRSDFNALFRPYKYLLYLTLIVIGLGIALNINGLKHYNLALALVLAILYIIFWLNIKRIFIKLSIAGIISLTDKNRDTKDYLAILSKIIAHITLFPLLTIAFLSIFSFKNAPWHISGIILFTILSFVSSIAFGGNTDWYRKAANILISMILIGGTIIPVSLSNIKPVWFDKYGITAFVMEFIPSTADEINLIKRQIKTNLQEQKELPMLRALETINQKISQGVPLTLLEKALLDHQKTYTDTQEFIEAIYRSPSFSILFIPEDESGLLQIFKEKQWFLSSTHITTGLGIPNCPCIKPKQRKDCPLSHRPYSIEISPEFIKPEDRLKISHTEPTEEDCHFYLKGVNNHPDYASYKLGATFEASELNMPSSRKLYLTSSHQIPLKIEIYRHRYNPIPNPSFIRY